MRRHVARVARRRRDARVGARRLQPHRGMLAIVERVERVVRRARMLRVPLQHGERDRRRPSATPAVLRSSGGIVASSESA